MSSLRDALGRATLSLQEQISAAAVKQVKATSGEVVEELKESYADFFNNLYAVINSPGVADASGAGSPSLLGESLSTSWREVSDRWWNEKFKARNLGYSEALGFYHGITEAYAKMRAHARANGGRKRKFTSNKKRSNTSLDKYLQALSMGGMKEVEHFFGPMKVAYEVIRPDGGAVKVDQIYGLVTKIFQQDPRTKRIATAIDGTIIRTTITAFPNLAGVTDESSLWKFMGKQGGALEKQQWVKTSGGRPLVAPLIKWYMDKNFRYIIQERFA